MAAKRRYWIDQPDAPFAALLSVVEAYCHPEAADESYEELKAHAQDPNTPEPMDLFKAQLRSALERPGQLDPDDHLSYAAEYTDGTPERFLRRLWRDLYPTELVPGGDEEFRGDLRRTITGELDRGTSTTRYYLDLRKDLAEEARRVWGRFYPDEPVPGGVVSSGGGQD